MSSGEQPWCGSNELLLIWVGRFFGGCFFPSCEIGAPKPHKLAERKCDFLATMNNSIDFCEKFVWVIPPRRCSQASRLTHKNWSPRFRSRKYLTMKNCQVRKGVGPDGVGGNFPIAIAFLASLHFFTFLCFSWVSFFASFVQEQITAICPQQLRISLRPRLPVQKG